ncbi:MAG TPA: hypothetical protein VHT34_06945 [Clostridia bacterium]|nr:hypothetical protein [Clostridia bacterium]
MEIKDSQGKYTLKFDTSRRVCYEKQIGFWNKDDVERFHNDYTTKVGPVLANKPWSKISDLREYKTSSINDAVAVHVKWMQDTKADCVAVIVDSAIVKLQMNNAGAGLFKQMAFTDENEADKWLKAQGY